MTQQEIDYTKLHDYVWTGEDDDPNPLAVNISVEGFNVEMSVVGPDAGSILNALSFVGSDDYLETLSKNLEEL